MLKDAEIAMRHGKRMGGNRIEVFSTLRSDRFGLEADPRRALDRGEIKVLFQPIVRLEDRTVAGSEALLRWNHPRLGRLGPDKPYPNQRFTAVIFGDDCSKFGEPDRTFQGKHICVTGEIQLYRQRLEIIVHDPEQLKE